MGLTLHQAGSTALTAAIQDVHARRPQLHGPSGLRGREECLELCEGERFDLKLGCLSYQGLIVGHDKRLDRGRVWALAPSLHGGQPPHAIAV